MEKSTRPCSLCLGISTDKLVAISPSFISPSRTKLHELQKNYTGNDLHAKKVV